MAAQQTGTTLVYNGVEIRKCLTRNFRQENVYDQSNSDLLFHRFTVTVVGYVHGTQNFTTVGIVPPGFSTSDATVNQRIIRALLLEPRKRFDMSVGDETLLSCAPRITGPDDQKIDNNVHKGDLDSGPKPKHCNVTMIAGTRMYQVEYEIEICKLECASNGNQSGVLSNRWSMRDSIDGNWYTTRTMSGRLRVADVNLNPQTFRYLIVPPLQDGFKRESIETMTDPNGLELEYTVVDREVFTAAPAPATEWQATHRVMTNDGNSCRSECSTTVTGSKYANKVELIELAMDIVTQTLRLDIPQNKLEAAHIVDYLHENRVDVMASCMNYPIDQITPIPFTRFATGVPYKRPDYNPERSQVPNVFGTASLTGLWVSYLQSPCSPKHGVPQLTIHSEEKPGEGDRVTNTKIKSQTGKLPVDNDVVKNYSDESREAVYTFYSVETAHTTEPNCIQLPVSTDSRKTTDTCIFVDLARPVQYRDVVIAGQRYGAWPSMPKNQDGETIYGNVKLRQIGREIVTNKAPALTSNGKTYLYETTLQYRLGYSRPLKANESLPIGKIPIDNSKSIDNRMPSSIYKSELNP